MKPNFITRKLHPTGFLACLVTVGFVVAIEAQAPKRNPPKSAESEAIKKLQSEVFDLKFKLDHLYSEKAIVHTEGSAYSLARTKFGPFIIVQKGLTPYLDGYKLQLAIGNPLAATFHGAKLSLSWGPPYDEKDVSSWLRNQKSKEVDITETLRPGSTTIVEVVLSPAKTEDVKEISVGIIVDVLSFDR